MPCNSETEHIISLTSVVGGNSLKGNLSRAFQGFVATLRIVDRQRELQPVTADPLEPLLHNQIGAVGMAGFVEPRSFVCPVRGHDERVIVLPLADRVPEPPRLGADLCRAPARRSR